MKQIKKFKLLLVNMLILLAFSVLPVHAEDELCSIESITNVRINFTKGNLYRYRGIPIEPEVLSVEFTDENGEEQERTEGFELKYNENSNNVELGYANVWLSMDGYTGEKMIESAFEIVVSRPRNVVIEAKNKGIRLAWDEVCGAYGYEIYRSNDKDMKGKLLAAIESGTVTSFVDESVKAVTKYYYTLKAFRDLDGVRHYSEDTKQIAQWSKLNTTEITGAERKTYNTIELEWKKVKNADGYRVYRSIDKNSNYERVTSITDSDKLSYKDTVPTCGRKYYYKVAAYKLVNGEKQSGVYSEPVSARTKPEKIQFTDKSASKSTSVTLRWKESKGAKGYEIYRSTKKNSDYELIKTIKDAETLKWTNKELNDEKVYYYKIRPYTSVNDEKVFGLYSKAYEKILIPEEIEEITEYTYVKYRSGGNTPKGWDCSGFTQWVYKNIYGKAIPRSSREQAKIGKSISKNDMDKWKPGDILVYAAGGRVNHVGLYLGNGKMMHALNSKYGTVIQDVDYYESWDSRNNLKYVRRCL